MKPPTELAFRKSTYSGSQDNCVETAKNAASTVVHVRDSKDPRGPQIVLEPGVFSELTDRIKAGELDKI